MSQLFVIQLTDPAGALLYFAEGSKAHALYAVAQLPDAKTYTRAATALARRARLLNSLPRGWSVQVVLANV